ALFSGCLQVYRAETTVHANGRVERSIYQPLSETPEAAHRPERWHATTYPPPPADLEKEGWVGPISQWPVRPPKNGNSYFAAWGAFPSVRDIPDHVVIKADEAPGLPEGRLVREHERRDYVFAVEHRWRETLTDAVRLDDLRKARAELAELLIGFWSDVITESLGR